MITINLLPESYRPQKAGSIQQFHRSPLALILAAVLVGSPAGLAAWRGMSQVRLSQVRAKLDTLATKKAAIDRLKASLSALQRQARALEATGRQRGAWAPRLNAIADVTPLGVWFTELTLDPQKLVLEGAAVKQRGDGMTAVNRLVQDLKQDPRLASVISDIQLGNIRNVQDGDMELMEFTITCKLVGP